MKDEQTTQTDTDHLAAQADTGARHPQGFPGRVLLLVPVLWSVFQLWYASPLPFVFNFGVLNDTEARSIHLAFATFLAYLAFPATKRGDLNHIPWIDWVMASAACLASAYLFLFYDALSERPGAPTRTDLVVAVIGIVLLLEATRRALGPPLMVVAMLFLFYTFAGPYMPEAIAHKGASLNKAMSHQWLSTEGVFGIAIGVSTSFVFLFVLFGALLEQAGAGQYFIRVAFSLLGHYRGGPAKAAVVSSAMTGMISGSSIANVVTTGTFTIPLMKRVGFPAHKAGAVEVASSTNGQLTPPIMGAAAFLMVEYVGISYIEVIKHAFLPALASYVALVYIVHLEACKAGMRGLPRPHVRPWTQTLLTLLAVVIGLMILTLAVYYGIGWLKTWLPSAALWIVSAGVIVAYLGLVAYAARYPATTDLDEEIVTLPEPGPTIKSGLYFLLPVVLLVWCLTVERFSPALSAFWATVFMVAILLTQRPLLAWFRQQGDTRTAMLRGLADLFNGLHTGARNMIGIGVATATAGIVVGTVTLTGIGLVMTEFVEFISGGNLVLMLLFTALISLILGMGLPTTANYIVVSTLMAPVIVTLGAQSGLIVPLIAVHMFVFYFGILADDTPPVGLAAFAAAAIARSDPIRTGIQGFTYDIRTAILPFMFIFNTELLLIGIDSWLQLAVTVTTGIGGMLIFAAATQGYWLTRSRLWESLALLLVAFTLLRPGFWWDRLFPPLEILPATQILEVATATATDDTIRFTASGETLDGEQVRRSVVLSLDQGDSGEARLATAGLTLRREDGRVLVEDLTFGSPAEQSGLDFDWEIESVQRTAERLPKQLMFGPALLLLGGLAWVQHRRGTRQAPSARTGGG